MANITEEEPVLFEQRGHVAILTLNRPRQHNACNAALSAAMEKHLDTIDQTDEIFCAIICSSHPKTFSAGADLKAVSKGQNIESKTNGFAGLVKYPLRKPMIAAVGGTALAGGCEIVLACDLLVATSNATFGVPEVKRSLVPAAGGMFRLPRRLPRAVAMEMVLTGDRITAKRAHELGFVNVLVEPGADANAAALEAALALAARITVNAPVAVREAACVVRAATLASDEEAWELSQKAMHTLVQTEDFFEGPRAFVEKRAPVWTGKARL